VDRGWSNVEGGIAVAIANKGIDHLNTIGGR
jgi:hypothetical protein